MKIGNLLLILIHQLCFLFGGCDSSKTKVYNVKFIDKDIAINGIINEKEWINADSIVGLCAPWDSIPRDETIFKSCRSNHFFYFYFDVMDTTIITKDFEQELTVAEEDRVELFFSADPYMNQYFCIEMDPIGRILDYSAKYYRKFNEQWDFNQVKIAAKKSTKGYIIEGCISIGELKSLGIRDSFHMGVFRADYRSLKTDDVVWYSWIKPDSKTADFHIPSALGIFIFNP